MRLVLGTAKKRDESVIGDERMLGNSDFVEEVLKTTPSDVPQYE